MAVRCGRCGTAGRVSSRAAESACCGSSVDIGVTRLHRCAKGRLAQQLVRPAFFQGPTVRGARMDALEPCHQFRTARVQSAARSGGLDHEAHLDVGGRKLLAREPAALRQFALHEVPLQLELRLNVSLQYLLRYCTRDRAHKKRRLSRESAKQE